MADTGLQRRGGIKYLSLQNQAQILTPHFHQYLLEQVTGIAEPYRCSNDAVKEFKCENANEKLYHSDIKAPSLASHSHTEKRGRWGAQVKRC